MAYITQCYFLFIAEECPIVYYTTFGLCIYQLIDIWLVSRFGLSWMMLLRIFTYKSLCAQMFSLLLDRILGTELLDRMVALYLIFKETDKMFSKELYILTFPPTANPAMYEGSNFFTFFPVLGIDCLLITNILLDIIALWFNVYFPTKNNREHLFLCLSTIYLLWLNVYFFVHLLILSCLTYFLLSVL